MKPHPMSALPSNGLGDVIPKSVLPSPLNYGWTLDGKAYTAVTSDLPPAPSAVVENVQCGCTTACAPHHLAPAEKSMACTELCACKSGDSASCETNQRDM